MRSWKRVERREVSRFRILVPLLILLCMLAVPSVSAAPQFRSGQGGIDTLTSGNGGVFGPGGAGEIPMRLARGVSHNP